MGDSDPDDLQQELLDTGEQKGNPMTTMYDLAREEYAALGIDTEAVMEKLAAKPISVHCWPVSYTHLDVYKRQRMGWGAAK